MLYLFFSAFMSLLTHHDMVKSVLERILIEYDTFFLRLGILYFPSGCLHVSGKISFDEGGFQRVMTSDFCSN